MIKFAMSNIKLLKCEEQTHNAIKMESRGGFQQKCLNRLELIFQWGWGRHIENKHKIGLKSFRCVGGVYKIHLIL